MYMFRLWTCSVSYLPQWPGCFWNFIVLCLFVFFLAMLPAKTEMPSIIFGRSLNNTASRAKGRPVWGCGQWGISVLCDKVALQKWLFWRARLVHVSCVSRPCVHLEKGCFFLSPLGWTLVTMTISALIISGLGKQSTASSRLQVLAEMRERACGTG